jgi:hypothetical protein
MQLTKILSQQLVIASVYSRKSAAQLQASEGKAYLTMANASGEKAYDWKNKKSFRLERNELYIIRDAIKIALFEGPKQAKDFCTKMLGSKRDCPYFTHQNKGKIAMGGVLIGDISTDERYDSYSPLTFRITYKGESGDNSISCAIPKSNAYQILEDLSKYLDESARNIARVDSYKTRLNIQKIDDIDRCMSTTTDDDIAPF